MSDGWMRAVDLWWSRELLRTADIAKSGTLRLLDEASLEQVSRAAAAIVQLVAQERTARRLKERK